jgi:general secretion pathway protein A
MYEAFFGCRERPFDLSPNPRYLVLTAAHREALSTIEYVIASRKGMAVLIGEAGTGKTTVIRAALERQPSRVHYVHLHNPALTRDEFVEMLASRFGLSDRARASKTTLLLELEALLRSRQAAGETTLLVLDEAQSLPIELLEEVRLLANIETNDDKLISVIMAGQPELAQRLNDPALRQLKQRIALRCELRPLAPQETLAYVAGRLKAAGCTAPVFTRDAVALMHQQSRGIPRTLSVIGDNAMLTAFAQGQRPVTTKVVLEVCREFDIAAPNGDRPERLQDLAQVVAAESAKAAPPQQNDNRLLFLETATSAGDGTPMSPAAQRPRPEQVTTAASAPAEQRSMSSGLLPRWRRLFLFS